MLDSYDSYNSIYVVQSWLRSIWELSIASNKIWEMRPTLSFEARVCEWPHIKNNKSLIPTSNDLLLNVMGYDKFLKWNIFYYLFFEKKHRRNFEYLLGLCTWATPSQPTTTCLHRSPLIVNSPACTIFWWYSKINCPLYV